MTVGPKFKQYGPFRAWVVLGRVARMYTYIVERTELDVILLQDELVYPGAERSEGEYCCYPTPWQWPFSSSLPVGHAFVQ
jgi:hypothetical protein